MTQLPLNESLPGRLVGLTEPVEITDDSGLVLGRYHPISAEERYEFLTPEISKEERERRRQNPGTLRTTAEVLKRLESL